MRALSVFVASAVVLVGGCGSTETAEQDDSDLAPVEQSAPPNPAEPAPTTPPGDAPPTLEPEPTGSAPAWWQDEAVITDDRVLVFATVDSETYFDAREKAIDAAIEMLVGHDAEPLPAEIVFSADRLDDGGFRVWVRMAGAR